MFITRSIIIILMLLPLALQAAAEDNLQCHKVIIGGNSQWPPYTIIVSSVTNDGQPSVQLKGVGIDLAKRIFKELDVPVEEFAYSDLAMMMQGLRDGEIDLIVSTYDTSGIAHDVQLLRPAYVIDPITVAVQMDMSKKVTSWDSLAGLNGVKDLTFTPDDQTHDYISSYLHIPNQDSLLAGLQSVVTGTNKFMIGSDLQLTYAIKEHHLTSDLIVMKNLHKGGDVYMAFSSKSACKQYAIYVQKRLQDYKNNGTVEKVLKKYIY